MNPHARVEGLSVPATLLRAVFRGWQHLRAGRAIIKARRRKGRAKLSA